MNEIEDSFLPGLPEKTIHALGIEDVRQLILSEMRQFRSPIQVGSGSQIFKASDEGIQLGSGTFASAPFRVTPAGALTASSATISGSITATSGLIAGITINAASLTYGKTGFADATNAGFYIGALGIYFGSAADASKLKYTIADGTFDFIGTVSSRSTATLAAAINSTGNLVNDVINARLDSSSKSFLSDFSFGAADYAGAVKAGSVTWNTTTGAITGGSGVLVYRGGILGVASGTTTFYIDPATGSVTLSGSITSTSGAIGGWAITATTIQDVAGVVGMSSAVTVGDDIRFWAGNVTPASAPFYVTESGALVASSATITGSITATSGLISGITINAASLTYGKADFTDSTNAGFYIGALGIYFGAAADASKLKYTIADGTFDFIGTISSRSTLTIASSINASGQLVNDVVNARLDSSAKSFLADFSFGAADYAGAVKAGSVTWNSTTGAITGGSGVLLYRGGILGVATGVTTFFIDPATGSVTLVGDVTATSGYFQSVTLGKTGTASGTLTLQLKDGTGDTYIATGKTDFTTTDAGFILGLDDSDSDKAKFYLGDATNYLTWDGTNLVIAGSSATLNGSSLALSNFFGDASDGSVTFDGSSVVLGLTPSSSIYTLTRDILCSSITVDNGVTIKTAGFRIFCTGTLTNNGNINANGGDASGATAGTASGDGVYYGGRQGAAGDADSGAAALSPSYAYNVGAGVGGDGGNSGIYSGGTGTAISPPAASVGAWRNQAFFFGAKAFPLADDTPVYSLIGALGAGSGAGDGVNRGGASGGGAGILYIASATITNTSGTISANGGAGGNGTAGNAAGGGGGGGGTIVLVYKTLNSGTQTVTGGALGTGVGAGTNGTAGADGTILTFKI